MRYPLQQENMKEILPQKNNKKGGIVQKLQQIYKINQLYFLSQMIINNQINIINTRQMIFPQEHIKIEQDSPGLVHILPHSEEGIPNRQGNSHIFAKTGHWNEDEKLRYLLFIDYHSAKLAIREKRRMWKVFKAMSSFVRTRKPNQCRSHHQKMESYFQSIPAIIAYFKHKITNYQQEYQRSLQELSKVEFGFSFPESFDQILEESISNNESLPIIPKLKKLNRHRSSNTSINLADEDHRNELTDKDLPKTDHSLGSIPQEKKINFKTNQRMQLNYEELANEDVPNQNLYLFYPGPSFPFLSMDNNSTAEGLPYERRINFFEYHRRQSNSSEEANEWSECERLYLLWRNTLESLIHSNL